ncbi:hypothetical protein GGTG_05893 [Gaeumannomyces tritici R3-111a-1]|uniref:Uncharacterized protein n=1 Tax=Gaeumannomyces tritici (strain R3-111a-1) TaxID=644352 RepID=J3NX86_GAET3|nr:hypothetical protein GGTG_05893 [Gaeumannomyces tritici R3-111a-1]EJT75968.1 hypothetical protein GGTG_05893 [Gaeumannomyces tritici R3-111a-1]
MSGSNSNSINDTLPWTYNGKPIAPYTDDEPYGAAQITSRVLGLASNSNSTSVQTMMEGILTDKKLQREIVPKQARKTILIGGRLVFGGACTNCVNSGHRPRCSLIPKADTNPPKKEPSQGSFLDRFLMATDAEDLEQLRKAVDSALSKKKTSIEPHS